MRLRTTLGLFTVLCLAGFALAEGDLQNEHFASAADQKSAQALDQLSTLSIVRGKPAVAVVLHVKDTGSEAADHLADIGAAMRDSLVKLLQGPVAVVDAPDITDTSLAGLSEAAARKVLAEKQIDEVLLLDLHLQHDGTMSGSCDWCDVRDTSSAPVRVCAQQVAQAWDLRQKSGYMNFRYNVPMLSKQLVGLMVPTYVTNRQEHQTVIFDVLGRLDVQVTDAIVQFLGRQPGAQGKVVAVQRADPKAAGASLTEFRVQGTLDVLAGAAALAQWLRTQPGIHVDVLELSPVRALLSIYTRPQWFELTDAKGDASLHKRFAELPIYRAQAAILVDPIEIGDGRKVTINHNAGTRKLRGGITVSTLMGQLGDAIARTAGAKVMDIDVEDAAIAHMVQTTATFHGNSGALRQLSEQRRVSFAWVLHLYDPDANGYCADLVLEDLRSGTQLAFTSWNGTADDAVGAFAVDPAKAESVARYLTGKTLMKMLDRPSRAELMLVSVKGCSADEMFRLESSLQHTQGELLDVRDATFDYGMGRFNVCFNATDGPAIERAVQEVAQKLDLATDGINQGIVDLHGKPPAALVAAPVTPVAPPAPRVDAWAAIIGVGSDCYGVNPLLSSSDGTSCFRQMLSETCHFPRDHMMTLLKGLGDAAAEPSRQNIRVRLGPKGLGQAGPHDLAVFCFSGHVRSLPDIHGAAWNLVPCDANEVGTAETLVPIADVVGRLRRDVAARDKVLMLDCYLTPEEKAPAADLVKFVEQQAPDMTVLLVCHHTEPMDGEKTLATLVQQALHSANGPVTVSDLVDRLKHAVTAPEHAFLAPTTSGNATLVASASMADQH